MMVYPVLFAISFETMKYLTFNLETSYKWRAFNSKARLTQDYNTSDFSLLLLVYCFAYLLLPSQTVETSTWIFISMGLEDIGCWLYSWYGKVQTFTLTCGQ
jgi:hypothetical protein